MLKVKNTLGRELQEFKSINEGKVSIYHCGPTVYWTQHIGNLRGMTMGDLIRRSLIFLGYEVRYVRNYTDFGHLTGDNIGDADTGEDRMEKTAKKEKISPQEVANKFIEEFENDTNNINLLEPTKKTRATEYIDEMKNMIRELIDNGYAYVTPEAVYFDVEKFEHYTDLSGQILDKNKVGAGFGDNTGEEKKNPYDFAIWFFKTRTHANALQYWQSDFESPEVKDGEGIPGWHIECSAMARAELGDSIDIHIGGVEHISIHHTNEIAQSESANGKKYVKYWLHNEHLTVDGAKMSKSGGTAYVLNDVLERGFTGLDLRYFYLQAHYRSKQNFTFEALEASKKALENLRDKVANLTNKEILEFPKDHEDYKKFKESIEDDFNTPMALAVVWDMLSNPDEYTYSMLLEFDKILGLDLYKIKSVEKIIITKELGELLKQRKQFKISKDFDNADRIRDIIREQFSLDIKDEKNGSQILTRI